MLSVNWNYEYYVSTQKSTCAVLIYLFDSYEKERVKADRPNFSENKIKVWK